MQVPQQRPLTMLLDGNALMNVMYRASLPEAAKKSENPNSPEFFDYLIKNRSGEPVNGLKLFMKYVTILLNAWKPAKFAVAFDVPGGSDFRKKACPEYKATRDEKPAPLLWQIKRAEEWLQYVGIPVYMDSRCEADDVIYSLSSKESVASNVIVITTDHDYYQMVNDRVKALMYIPNAKKWENLKAKYPDKCMSDGHFCLTDKKMIESETGVKPYQIPDYKGLYGDTSDNITGVKGIGEKTARELLTMYPTIDSIYEAINKTDEDILAMVWKAYPDVNIRGAAKVIQALKEHEKDAKMSKWLATAWSNVPVNAVPNLNIYMDRWTQMLDWIK